MSSKRFNLTLNKKILPYKKVIKVDSDKSISIRSFLIGSISHDISKVKNVLESQDVFSTINFNVVLILYVLIIFQEAKIIKKTTKCCINKL